jgi:hypothetical protein
MFQRSQKSFVGFFEIESNSSADVVKLKFEFKTVEDLPDMAVQQYSFIRFFFLLFIRFFFLLLYEIFHKRHLVLAFGRPSSKYRNANPPPFKQKTIFS